MRSARPLIASLAVLLVAFAGDLTIGRELRHAATAFGSSSTLFGIASARLVAVALVLVVARMAFDGPRDRLVGGTMLVIGFFFVYWPSLDSAGLPLAHAFFADAYSVPTAMLAWTAAGVAVIGAAMAAWPTRQPGPQEDPLNTFRQPSATAGLALLALVMVGLLLVTLAGWAALNAPRDTTPGGSGEPQIVVPGAP
jgi:hypothetical protein